MNSNEELDSESQKSEKKQTGHEKKLVIGWLGGGGGLLLHHPPGGLSGDRSRSRGRAGGRARGVAPGFDLVDESLDGGELLGQVAQVSLEGVELFVEVVQSLRQRLDPERGETW